MVAAVPPPPRHIPEYGRYDLALQRAKEQAEDAWDFYIYLARVLGITPERKR